MNRFLFPILLTGTLVLTACSASDTPPQIPAEPTPSLGTMPASTKTVQLVTNPPPLTTHRSSQPRSPTWAEIPA